MVLGFSTFPVNSPVQDTIYISMEKGENKQSFIEILCYFSIEILLINYNFILTVIIITTLSYTLKSDVKASSVIVHLLPLTPSPGRNTGISIWKGEKSVFLLKYLK